MAAHSPKDMLASAHLKPKKSWGQNFLDDPDALEQIVDAAAVTTGDVVLELGAGLGHLTRALLATGASVVAVERDRDLVAVLEKSELPNLRVVAANAAELEYATTAGVPDAVVVGNLPYHLSSVILFNVLDQSATVKRAVFTLQKEVVERICAVPGGRTYGLLSALLGHQYRLEHVATLPAAIFYPPPDVDSAVVRMDRLKVPRGTPVDAAHYRRVVKAAFAQRRKTLLNSLRSDETLGSKTDLEAALSRAGIDGTRRGETLSVEEFAALAAAIPLSPSGAAP